MKYCGCLFMRIVSLVSEVTFSSHFWVTCRLSSVSQSNLLKADFAGTTVTLHISNRVLPLDSTLSAETGNRSSWTAVRCGPAICSEQRYEAPSFDRRILWVIRKPCRRKTQLIC